MLAGKKFSLAERPKKKKLISTFSVNDAIASHGSPAKVGIEQGACPSAAERPDEWKKLEAKVPVQVQVLPTSQVTVQLSKACRGQPTFGCGSKLQNVLHQTSIHLALLRMSRLRPPPPATRG